MRTQVRPNRFVIAVLVLFMASLACTPPDPNDIAATAVSAALTEVSNALPTIDIGQVLPTEPTATNTPTPPPGGVSMNCDGTYQKLTIVDGGAAGKTATLSNLNGSAWIDVWSVSGGDPMIQQIEAEAGLFSFGACKQLIVIPLRYSGSGAVLDVTIYEWTGAAVVQVYYRQGVHGGWSKDGDTIAFEESLYLYGEPNCCPCNRQTTRHTWNGTSFAQTDQVVTPTYTGPPPEYCTP